MKLWIISFRCGGVSGLLTARAETEQEAKEKVSGWAGELEACAGDLEAIEADQNTSTDWLGDLLRAKIIEDGQR